MSGCAVCVYDLYEESLDVYKEKIAELTAQLTVLGVPQSEWPSSIQEKSDSVEKKQNVALSVFEEMERALKEKQNSRQSVHHFLDMIELSIFIKLLGQSDMTTSVLLPRDRLHQHFRTTCAKSKRDLVGLFSGIDNSRMPPVL